MANANGRVWQKSADRGAIYVEISPWKKISLTIFPRALARQSKRHSRMRD
jgi:hypothetical protein